MLKNYQKIIMSTVLSVVCFSGCSSKNTVFPDPDADIKKEIENNSITSGSSRITYKKVMPYQQKVSLLVESRSNEAKVVIDAGKVLKILVNSYKRNGTLIASHDIYTYVKKPGFIVGQNVPQRATDGLITPLGKLPFDINKDSLNINAQKEELKTEDVKNFINNYHKEKYGFASKDDEKIEQYKKKRDTAILNYLKMKKAEK